MGTDKEDGKLDTVALVDEEGEGVPITGVGESGVEW